MDAKTLERFEGQSISIRPGTQMNVLKRDKFWNGSMGFAERRYLGQATFEGCEPRSGDLTIEEGEMRYTLRRNEKDQIVTAESGQIALTVFYTVRKYSVVPSVKADELFDAPQVSAEEIEAAPTPEFAEV